MSLFGSMKTAVSGMNAQANRLGTVGDNIANSSTAGYKKANASFSSLVLQANSGSYNSGGVSTKTGYSISQQGSMSYTPFATNVAIQGEGFFVVEDGSGNVYLTRAGDFTPNEAGVLTNSAGFAALGYPYGEGNSPTAVINSYQGLAPIVLGSAQMSASPSTKGDLVVNLPAAAASVGGPIINLPPSANGPNSSYNYKMQYKDGTGTTDVYYTKLNDTTWEISVYVDYSGKSSGLPYDMTTGTVVSASTQLSFDPATGVLVSGNPRLYPDASDPYYLDFSGLQQSAGTSTHTVSFKANMPSDVPEINTAGGNTPASSNVAGVSYTLKQTVSNIPGLSGITTLDVYYTKTSSDTWEIAAYDAGLATAGGFPYGAAGSPPLAVTNLVYDSASGAMTSAAAVDIPLSSGSVLRLDFSGSVSIPDGTAGFDDGVTMSFNLPISASPLQPSLSHSTPAANLPTSEFTGKTSMTVFDVLGNSVLLDIYFTKGDGASWEVAVFDNAGASSGGFPYSTSPLTTSLLSFDPADGKLVDGGLIKLTVPNGAELTLDLSQTTQLAADFSVKSGNVNGSAASSATSYSISQDGIVYANYGSGSIKALYQIALATVASPDNLSVESGNVFRETSQSGKVTLGYAGLDGFGAVISGAIENSNVDMASELTEMIVAQRSYAANSKVFQTGSDMMQELLGLVR